MGSRFWIGGILFVGLLYWGISYVVTPNGGDAEFQKMLEATKQVKSFRGVYTGSGSTPGKLWEVDCNRGIVHKQSQDASGNPIDDQFLVGSDQLWTHTSDGSWKKSKYTAAMYSASWYCDNLAQGTLRDLLPDTRGMLRSAMIGKSDKKTVDGAQCQQWRFAMQSANSGQKGFLCIGLEDHLPHEMTTDDGGHYSYTDYNQPPQFDAPYEVLQSSN